MTEYEEIMGADITEHDVKPDVLFQFPNGFEHMRAQFAQEEGERRRSSFGFLVRTDSKSLRRRPQGNDPEMGLENMANGNRGHENRGHDNKAFTIPTVSIDNSVT